MAGRARSVNHNLPAMPEPGLYLRAHRSVRFATFEIPNIFRVMIFRRGFHFYGSEQHLGNVRGHRITPSWRLLRRTS